MIGQFISGLMTNQWQLTLVLEFNSFCSNPRSLYNVLYTLNLENIHETLNNTLVIFSWLLWKCILKNHKEILFYHTIFSNRDFARFRILILKNQTNKLKLSITLMYS